MFQLPGLAAKSRLYEFNDSYNRPFAMLHVPTTNHFTVVFSTEPDGASLVDPEQVDAWVANWGGWIAGLGDEAGLEAAAVTVETAPDSGYRLRNEVEMNIHADAPEAAKAILREVVRTYPEGSATVRAWVSLTFSAALRSGSRKREAEDVARDLASRIPGLGARLQATGAGIARPMSAQELCEVVRIAYDPPAALIIDEAHAAGSPVALTWGEVGPSATQASWDDYRHDGAFSASWTMTGAPRGSVNSSVLSRLLAPHGDIDRKRVSLLYRPMDSARAAAVVERDQNNANVRITSGNRPSARALVDARSAAQTVQEEAQGAGLVNFGLVVTATVTGADRLPDAVAAVEQTSGTAGAAAPGLRLAGHRLRRVPAARTGPAQTHPAAHRNQRGLVMQKLFRRKKKNPLLDGVESEARNRRASTARPARLRVPGSRGWGGRGGGPAALVPAVREYRGTTVQVCGLWPFSSGTSSPMVGVPLGRHEETQATVCCDPISWFQRAHLISNPSAFILGKPGLGKSTLVRRMMLGLSGQGVHPLVLGDLKGEHVDAISALGGQVIELGRGRGYLNILDPGQAIEVAQLLEERGHHEAAVRVRADAHGRRLNMVVSLITISRNNPPTDQEQTILDRALRVLDDSFDGVPVLKDLLDVIIAAPEELRQVALDRGDMTVYLQETRALEATLLGLTGGGKLGEIFSRHTTNPMRRDRAVVFDVSSIDETETDLQAAVLLACWSYGFGTVNVANALADAGLEPRRNYFVVLDELWRALRAGKGMVDRVDALTRLNRSVGVGQVMISHTMSDLLALPAEEDRMKARGFVERSGMVICGGLPASEMPLLTAAIPLSRQEQQKLISWQDPPAWDSRGGDVEPPGRGKFLIKVGGRPGIPVQIGLTSIEASLNDTNKKWNSQAKTLLETPAPIREEGAA